MFKINKYFLITRKIPTYLKYYLSKLGASVLSTVKGIMQITLEKSVNGGLKELKAFGKCEQTGTPTPEIPIPILCNNGELKIRNKSGLPLGYQKLEYLESTGTQYLELGVNDSNPNLEIETTFSDIGGSGYRYITGCWSRDSEQNTVIYINGNGQIGAWVCHAYTVGAMISADITKKHTVKVNKDAYYLDGNLVASIFESGTERTGAELYAFKRNGADGVSPQTTSITGKIHNISFKDNGVLIRNYIPARRNSDNVLGMYDLVTNIFLTNAGTGTFTAGPDIEDSEIYTDGTTETIEVDTTGDTAMAENLLSVGDYKDIQEIILGSVTRNVGIKVLTGNEDWEYNSSRFRLNISDYLVGSSIMDMIISHYKLPAIDSGSIANGEARFSKSGADSTTSKDNLLIIHDDNYTSLNSYKAWLASEYSAGTPVIIVYPLSTPVAETVTGETLNIQKGTNIIEVTEASLDDLEIEATYYKN